MDAIGLPVRAIITSGTVADCTQAVALIDGISAQHLLADKGYDTNTIIEQAIAQGMEPVILVENAFLHLKRWRGIATRYAKHTASFVAAIQIKCIEIWSKII